MAVPVDRFVESLSASGLITADQVHAIRNESSQTDGETLANELVARGLLTEYQAHAICVDQVNHLVLGDYKILDKIGEGGMGQVFKAVHSRLDRLAAIKLLTGDKLNDRPSLDRFHQEVKTAAQITHPNIVITYDASEQNGIHYLVMEYVDGEDVGAAICKRGAFPIDQTVDLFVQVARGLEYAHSRHVVHRDIKPGNLILDRSGDVKILDMGLARISGRSESLATTEAERLTNAKQAMGTLAYMPPEQAEDARRADARSDIYSLGCAVFQLITGAVPYPSDSLVESIMAHRESAIPSVTDRRPECPEWLNDVVKKCLSKRPEDRFQSATELIAAIEQNTQRSAMVDRSLAGIRNAVAFLVASVTSHVSTAKASAIVRRGSGRATPVRGQNTSDLQQFSQPIESKGGPANEPPLARTPGQQTVTRIPSHGKLLVKRHRGKRLMLLGGIGLILTPQVLGFFCGIAATILALADLSEMRANRKNQQGRTATTIGMGCGIAAVIRYVFQAIT